MFPRINPVTTSSWKEIQAHFESIKEKHLRECFQDSDRFQQFSIESCGIFLDYSKNRINSETLTLLTKLALECKLPDAIESLFSGDLINETEKRAVLHTALRNILKTPIEVKGENVMPQVESVWEKMKSITDKVISGEWKGYTGKPIQHIVNIGIGGSDLGPAMVVEALQHYSNHLDVRFVSNVDGTHISEALNQVDPETTLFVIASKSFTTLETMTNAHSARDWFMEYARDEKCICRHFIAVSTNIDAAVDFGIDANHVLEFWDWVGGRYSLWSAIGVSIAFSIGFDQYMELLSGAHEMDTHFYEEKEKSIPSILALLGIWYNNFFGAESHAVLPYNQYLNKLVPYLQQADMESNGKSVDRDGNTINYQTGPVVWGAPGTNGQHAFFQLIHQGTKLIPADFIAPVKSLNPLGDHHDKLLANFLAQTQALMLGKSEDEVISELKNQGLTDQDIERLTPFKIFEGNHPTNTILIEQLTPKTLGSLLAMYEHKIFVQGVIWNIYSFDQWGVELGKQLAKPLLVSLENQNEPNGKTDASTLGLIRKIRSWQS